MKLITSRRNDTYLRICSQIYNADRSSTQQQASAKASAVMPGMPYNLSYDYAMRKLSQYRRGKLAESQRPRWAHLSARVDELQRRYNLPVSRALQRELTEGTAPPRQLSASYAHRLFQRLRSQRPRRLTSSTSV